MKAYNSARESIYMDSTVLYCHTKLHGVFPNKNTVRFLNNCMFDTINFLYTLNYLY
jgi:hypothetical protein